MQRHADDVPGARQQTRCAESKKHEEELEKKEDEQEAQGRVEVE